MYLFCIFTIFRFAFMCKCAALPRQDSRRDFEVNYENKNNLNELIMDFKRKVSYNDLFTADYSKESQGLARRAIRFPNPNKKFPSLSLKNNEDDSQKRPNEPIFTTPYNDKKKVRTADTKTEPTENLQDRFDDSIDIVLNSVESTQNLFSKEPNISLEAKKPESNDSFISIFEKDDNNLGLYLNESPILRDNENRENLFGEASQFFNSTQVLKQLESAVLENPKIKEDASMSSSSLEKSPEGIFKIPEMLPEIDEEHLLQENKILKLNKRTHSIDNYFGNNTITSQCRKEVDALFEHIENSIYLMGTEENNKSQLSEEILDVIFCPDVTPDPSNPKSLVTDQSIAKIDWSSQILQSTTGFDASFGSVLKQALQNNAIKQSEPEKAVNATFVESNHTFTSIGPFYGLPIKVKNLIRHFKGIEELYDWQDECLKLPAIKTRKNLIYALPTSGGKTLVSEILMLREILCYKRNAIFVLPYVAIVQEKVWALSSFAVALDFLIEEYAASKGTYPPRKRRRKNSIYIATIEKALGLINSLIENDRINEIGLIVVDELHLIGEQGRGATLEALLTKLMFLKADIQIVGMSATIGNLNDLRIFLNADIYSQNFRPVELTEYVKCGSDIAKINFHSENEDDLFTVVRKSDFEYSDAVSLVDPDRIGGLVMEVIPSGSCLIFCSSKKNCENVAVLLCRVISENLRKHKKHEKEQLINSLRDETGSLCDVLKLGVQFGIAYHHSGLTNEERKIIEDSFRAGILCVICCTSTLAAGVNLPAQRVILRQPYVGKDFINLSRYKQMVGRAGRAGLGETGDSIVICTPSDLPKLRKMLLSPMDQAVSGMAHSDGIGLRHLLLSCISLGLGKTRNELVRISERTLLAVQNEILRVDIKRLTEKVIRDMFKMGALEVSNIRQTGGENASDISVQLNATGDSFNASLLEDSTPSKKRLIITNNTQLTVSKLGKAAIKGGLELTKAHILYEDLLQAQKSLVLLDYLHLLFLVTPYDLADQINPNMGIYFNLLTKLEPKAIHTAKVLGITESVTVKMLTNQPIKQVPKRVLNKFYLTLMLHDLWYEMPVFAVSEKYQINRGVVQNLMTNSASFASNVVNFCELLEEFWPFAHLLRGMSQRLSHCCMTKLIPLMELPAVKQSRARQLYDAGYKSLQNIAGANANDLVEKIEFMSRRVANQLIAAAKMLLLEKVENLREEAEDIIDGVENPNNFLS